MLVAAGLTVSGCQACDQAQQTAHQFKKGWRAVHEKQREVTNAAHDVRSTVNDVQNTAGNAKNEAQAALDRVSSGEDASQCSQAAPKDGTTEAFVETTLSVATKDMPVAQAALSAVSAGNAVVFFARLNKLAQSNDPASQKAASCVLDRFYELIPSYQGQLGPWIDHVSYSRTDNWYDLSAAEKVAVSRCLCDGNPLALTITRSIETNVPRSYGG